MLCIRDIGAAAAQALCQRYELELEYLADDADIAGSFWGAPEAGILGRKVLVRPDTPVHSFLHETSHIICMDPQIRDEHDGVFHCGRRLFFAKCLFGDRLSGVACLGYLTLRRLDGRVQLVAELGQGVVELIRFHPGSSRT